MASVHIDIPDATLVALKLDATNAGAELRMAAAIKLSNSDGSSGAAAELAGLPLIVFMSNLGDFGAETFKQTLHEIADDSANA